MRLKMILVENFFRRRQIDFLSVSEMYSCDDNSVLFSVAQNKMKPLKLNQFCIQQSQICSKFLFRKFIDSVDRSQENVSELIANNREKKHRKIKQIEKEKNKLKDARGGVVDCFRAFSMIFAIKSVATMNNRLIRRSSVHVKTSFISDFRFVFKTGKFPSAKTTCLFWVLQILRTPSKTKDWVNFV